MHDHGRVIEGRCVVNSVDDNDESKPDLSQMDPTSEQWEGSMSWEVEDTTVAEEIQKVDLASLTDWDE